MKHKSNVQPALVTLTACLLEPPRQRVLSLLEDMAHLDSCNVELYRDGGDEAWYAAITELTKLAADHPIVADQLVQLLDVFDVANGRLLDAIASVIYDLCENQAPDLAAAEVASALLRHRRRHSVCVHSALHLLVKRHPRHVKALLHGVVSGELDSWTNIYEVVQHTPLASVEEMWPWWKSEEPGPRAVAIRCFADCSGDRARFPQFAAEAMADESKAVRSAGILGIAAVGADSRLKHLLLAGFNDPVADVRDLACQCIRDIEGTGLKVACTAGLPSGRSYTDWPIALKRQLPRLCKHEYESVRRAAKEAIAVVSELEVADNWVCFFDPSDGE